MTYLRVLHGIYYAKKKKNNNVEFEFRLDNKRQS